MFATNPFAELSASIPAGLMQTYVVIMIILVAGGTLYDVYHKGSAKYFFDNWQKTKKKGTRHVGSGKMAGLAVQTVIVDALAAGEFCNTPRRLAHLLTMYGFVLYVVTTAIMVFGYASTEMPTPAALPLLWYLGALMVCAGGYWFWFFIRVDVSAEGHSPFRLVRADLFVVSLVLSTTFAIIWAIVETAGIPGSGVLLGLYLIATTVLFGSIPWSKFSHMFFKPAAALQKRVAEADGSRGNLPAPADKPEAFGSARTLPRHY